MESAILNKLNWRYATKKFNPSKKLSAEQLNTLCRAFDLTATSYGLQALKMVVIAKQTVKDRLVAHSWNQQQVSDASHVLVICRQAELDREYIKEHFKRVAAIRNTPKAVLEPYEQNLIASFDGKTQEQINNWMEKQAYIALGNLLTVCALEKIDSCPMEGFIPQEYDRILELEAQGLNAVLVLPVGFRADDDFMAEQKKVRRGTSEVIITV